MDLTVEELTGNLMAHPVFTSCEPHNLARLLPNISEKVLDSGEVLYKTGTPATHLYLVLRGGINISTDKQQAAAITGDLLGEETVVGEEFYLTDAVALGPTTVTAIPRESLQSLLDSEPHLIRDFYSSLFNRFTGIKTELAVNKETDENIQKSFSFTDTLGWILTILAPALILYLSSNIGLDWNSRLFFCVLSIAIIMWTFSLTPSFLIPGILSVLCMLFLGIAPSEVVLSGFTSGSFFMAMSVFGLTAVLIASGATYRLVLITLKFIPHNRFAYTMVMFFTGFAMTPIIPTYSGRVSIMSSPLLDIVEALKYRPSGKAATQLIAAAFSGTTHFASVFLTGTSINFLIYGLLPLQTRMQFTWGYWALAASVFAGVSILFYLLIMFFMFRSKEIPEISRDRLETQLKILGPLSSKEWIALAGILLFIIAVVTSSIHKIDTPWIGLAVLYIFLALGVLTDEEFRKGINWSFLVYLGVMIGLVNTMTYLELDQWLIGHFTWMNHYLQESFYLFVLILTLVITLMGFVVDEYTTITFFGAVLIPMALLNGINPWIMGFIILTATGWWLLPYQDEDFLLFGEIINTKKNIFSLPDFIKFNGVTIVIRIAAIYASIPFWKWLGLL